VGATVEVFRGGIVGHAPWPTNPNPAGLEGGRVTSYCTTPALTRCELSISALDARTHGVQLSHPVILALLSGWLPLATESLVW